ncbi:MAG TPA: hypothetical protein VMU18_03285 [Rhodoblastus sp.]|nr:hypothetical protein [Rhodoblastus sp.]
MSSDPGFSCRSSAFEQLLERIETRAQAGGQIAPPVAEEWLAPRFAGFPGKAFRFAAAIAAAYGAQQPPEENAPEKKEPRPSFDLLCARIRADFQGARSADDFRRLRRRCALLVHPDRLPEGERAKAEKFMAELNAAIDRAIKARAAPRPRA